MSVCCWKYFGHVTDTYFGVVLIDMNICLIHKFDRTTCLRDGWAQNQLVQ